MGCSSRSSNESEVTPELNLVSDSIINLGSAGGVATIVFESNDKWQINSKASWISFQGSTKGKGDGNITIQVGINKGGKRMSNVNIIAGNQRTVVKIVQKGRKLKSSLVSPSLLYNTNELNEIKSAFKNNPTGSLKTAFKDLEIRSNNGLKYNPKPDVYRGTNALTFYKKIRNPAALARSLAIYYYLTKDKRYAQKAIQIMEVWAKECANITYIDTPNDGMDIARSIYPILCAYDILRHFDVMDDKTKRTILSWFRKLSRDVKAGMFDWMSHDYYGHQNYQNHLVAFDMGMLAFGVVLNNKYLFQFALSSTSNPRDLYELISGSILMKGDPTYHGEPENAPPPQDGETYDRYRHYGPKKAGLGYANLTLKLLATCAQICQNNGIDMWSYVAPGGENLKLSFDYYSDFYRLKDACIKSDFYCGETNFGTGSFYEIGFAHYPNSQKLKKLINSGSFNRGSAYSAFFGYTRFLAFTVDRSK